MSERYSNVFALPQNLYAVGSPVMIAAGTLLKDNQTGKIVAQLKFRSISDKIIKAVKVKLDLFDTADSPIAEPVVYDYLDLSASRDAEFGQKTPVTIPNNKARSYHATVTEVVFGDKSVWTSNDEPWEALSEPSLLPIDDSELLKQYKMRFGYNCEYAVMEEKDLWHCACGTWNHSGENCHVCGNTLFELQTVDMAELNREKEVRISDEIKKNAEEKRKRTKKRNTILILSATICAVLVVIFSVLTSPKYIWRRTINEGFEHYANKNFREAEWAWAEAGMKPENKRELFVEEDTSGNSDGDRYKPTAEELLKYGEDSLYEYASYVSHRSFSEAILLYKMIPNYKDSSIIAEEMQLLLDMYLGEYVCLSKVYHTHYGKIENEEKEDNVLIYDLCYDDEFAGKINILQRMGEQYFIFVYSGEPFSVHKEDGYSLYYLDDDSEFDYAIEYHLNGESIEEDFVFESGGAFYTIWEKVS